MKKGYTNGGPGEILQAPDSESAFALLESMIELFRVTGNYKWITAAKDVTAYCSTWVQGFDYIFPKDCSLGMQNIKSCGSIFANVQNNHSAPGICTLSGQGILELYRETQELKYLELLQDITRGLPQYVSTPGRQPEDAPYGYVSERVNTSDWEGSQNIGATYKMSTWPETSILLTAIEIPSIYVDLKNNRTISFDSVTVSEIKFDKNRYIEISNPGNEDALISIFIDRNLTKKMPKLFPFDSNRILIKKGESIKYRL